MIFDQADVIVALAPILPGAAGAKAEEVDRQDPLPGSGLQRGEVGNGFGGQTPIPDDIRHGLKTGSYFHAEEGRDMQAGTGSTLAEKPEQGKNCGPAGGKEFQRLRPD